jgi:hypothetical protein
MEKDILPRRDTARKMGNPGGAELEKAQEA